MPKFKKQLTLRPTAIKSDFRILTKGQRVQIRASYPKKDLEILGVPINWETIRINQHWKMKFGVSGIDTNLTLKGELIAMLICNDGRKIRLTSKDFTKRDFLKVKKELWSRFGPKITHNHEVPVQ